MITAIGIMLVVIGWLATLGAGMEWGCMDNSEKIFFTVICGLLFYAGIYLIAH